MKTQQIKSSQCPSCNARLDAVSDAEGHTPVPGDYSTCIHCNCILVFTDDMGVRPATYEEVTRPEVRQMFVDMYYKLHKEKLN